MVETAHGNLQANLCRQISEYIGLRKEDQSPRKPTKELFFSFVWCVEDRNKYP